MKKIFALLLLSLVSVSAYADWGLAGAAALCSPNGQSFELVSTLETSGWGDIPAPPGAHKFHTGAGQRYQCKVGGSRVLLVIDVYPPGQGMGEGAGTITVDKLMVDNITVLKVADFNWVAVLGRPELTKVVIKQSKRGLTEKLCYKVTDPSMLHSHTHCVVKEINGSNYSFKRTRKKPRAA